ncbi:MAG: esterase-like activity of phytase family protein [Chitinophagaceae bacterium]
MRFISVAFIITSLFLLASCRTTEKIDSTSRPSISSLKFLDSAVVPFGRKFRGTTIGGLSGIDYVPSRNIYYLISDDPSAFNPARFYTAQITINDYRIDSVTIVAVDSLWDSNGHLYPDIRKDRTHSADVEALRYNPARDELIRTSEGQRVKNDSTHDLQDPTIVIMERDGRFKDSVVLPPNIHVFDQDKGVRHNMVFEGISFIKNNREFLVSLEGSLYEDGPNAATGDTTAWVRLLLFDRDKKRSTAQYAYNLDPVPHLPDPPGSFKINGISDILSVGNDRLLVVERAWSTGRKPSDIRVYLADLRRASDISKSTSLKSKHPRRPLTKKLLLNMDDLGFTIYNIEGVTFGPDLPNGHHTLVFVSDDNFLDNQQTQFLLFEVIP